MAGKALLQHLAFERVSSVSEYDPVLPSSAPDEPNLSGNFLIENLELEF